ncbi:hypothetical protein [Caulobacter flavus]|nr:hypothetical protein [Caulobacter flavus]
MQEIVSCLLNELTQLAQDEAGMQGITLPSEPTALRAVKMRLDSLTVVEITCALEPILGFEPKNIVRTGGYDSIDEALAHMVPRIETAWHKKHPGGH